MRRKTGKNILSIALALLMVLGLMPMQAMAASEPDDLIFDVTEGKITIEQGSSSGYIQVTYGSIPITTEDIPDTEQITIIGNSTANTITVADNVTANITLDNVNIDVPTTTYDCAFRIGDNAIVNLTLSGTNTLKSGASCAGLQTADSATLTIDAKDDDASDTLTATGGTGGAGIGGGNGGDGGKITISGGSVTAIGNGSLDSSNNATGSAGIGGGNSGAGGTITINGGSVKATGVAGAAIGGGANGAGGTINVIGGIVTATGGGQGAGIGGGWYGAGGKINISGGSVTATGGLYGAGIGGGGNGAGGTIKISGGTVTAEGKNGGAGIGGGQSGAGGTITISGGTISAEGKDNAMEIGNGDGGSDGTVQITGGSVYLVRGDTFVNQPKDSSGSNVYLNTLTVGSSSTVNDTSITGASIDGVADSYGTNDIVTDSSGKLYFWLPDNTTTDANVAVMIDDVLYGKVFTRDTTNSNAATLDNISIDNGSVTITQYVSGYEVTVDSETYGKYPYSQAFTISNYTGPNTITVQVDSSGNNGDAVEIILDSVSITASGCAFEIKAGAIVNLTLSGTNTLQSGTNYAGLQTAASATLTIAADDTTDTLTATGGANGAGIGGGFGSDGGTITISGGTVTAKGGDSGAGIGGGADGDGGKITISGGSVTAIGNGILDSANDANGSAGIGGGNSGTGGTITINGGSVKATGVAGAGIGGGANGAGGTINVIGGSVTATGGGQGAGIGGGQRGIGGIITISGGSVTATGGLYGAGIGGGGSGAGGEITIIGGTISADGKDNDMDIGYGAGGNAGTVKITGGSVYPKNGASKVIQPTDGTNDVYYNELTVGSPSTVNETSITGATIDGVADSYGINDVYTDTDGKLYFWLPQNTNESATVSVTANNNIYKNTWARTAATESKTLLLLAVTPSLETMQDVTVTRGTSVNLSVTATASGGTLRYQWYSCNDASGAGAAVIVDATDASYSPDTSTAGTYYYYVLVTNSSDSTYPSSAQSNVVTLTVTTPTGVSTDISYYTLSFNTNGGTSIDALRRASGTRIDLSQYKPSREGYTFDGWYSDASLTTQISSVTLSSNTTVYAKWTADAAEEKTVTHEPYISGYTDGTFRPDSSISRAEVAQLLYNISGANASGTNQFSDVASGAWYDNAVTTLASKGVISGYTDGTFRPDSEITRAEFVALVVRYAGLSEGSGSSFSDVSADDWAAGYISAAAQAGFISGYTDGTFRPDSSIIRAEAVTILNAMLAREIEEDALAELSMPFSDVPATHWAYEQILEAAVAHEHSDN